MTFTDDDRMQPVYCVGCRQHIPRLISNANRGLCLTCVAKIQAPTAPPQKVPPIAAAQPQPQVAQFIAPPIKKPKPLPPSVYFSIFTLAVSFIVAFVILLNRQPEPVAQPSEPKVQASQIPPSTTYTEPLSTQRPYEPTDKAVDGYEPLGGNIYAGTQVYVIGWKGLDPGPPRPLFTIIDPVVHGDDDRRMMRVRYTDGTEELKDRDALVFENKGSLWVSRS